MTCPNHCLDKSVPVEPKLMGRSGGGWEIYFCPVCERLLRNVGGVLVVSPVCRGKEKAEAKQSEKKKARPKRAKRKPTRRKG